MRAGPEAAPRLRAARPPPPALSLGFLGSVLRAALSAILDSDRVERAADDVVAHPGEVLHASAADQDHGVLLQVVADARDVGRDLDAVGQAHARNFAECRIRFLRGRGVDARAHAALLRRALQGGRRLLAALLRASVLDELVDGRHPKAVRGPLSWLPRSENELFTQPDHECQTIRALHATASGVVPGAGSSSAPSGSSVTASIPLYFDTPVPAGIRRPMMTFSFKPTRRSTLPLIAASVRTLVVSWKEAAEMKLSVERLALVMPRRSGSAPAGCPPSPSTRSFSSSKRHFSTWSPIRKSVSPTSLMRTRRSICRTITSMCLSLMRTPCRRDISCTPSTRDFASAFSPRMVRMSCGFELPSMSASPAFT